MISKKDNKLLVKALKEKKRKPSWFARRSRKKLVEKIVSCLANEQVDKAWAHQEFVSAVEKKPQSIVIYASFKANAEEGIAPCLDAKMDTYLPKYKINIINVDTLLPSIKTSIFKELTQIL
jgi:hypothetical protein